MLQIVLWVVDDNAGRRPGVLLPLRRPLALLLTAVLLTAGFGTPAAAGPAASPGREAAAAAARTTGRWIVTLKPGQSTDAVVGRFQRRSGAQVTQTYRHAVRGFAARLSAQQVAGLRRDPAVAAVVADVRVRATAAVAAGDTMPPGVQRIGPTRGPSAAAASTARVAVIDSGIDLDHPDLVVRDGVNCVSGGPADDDNGHGTHVAGTIGARNDGAGVVGVAPGTEVVAVKVLDATGAGYLSDVVCGVDWVTGTRTDSDPGNDVAVANMSLGWTDNSAVGTCATTFDPLHRAICRATAAGITVVVAAGNSAWEFDHPTEPDVPAAYPEVLTVTAMADTDGVPGAGGPSACGEPEQLDDTPAYFSNFALTAEGDAHTVAAPGFCVRSTWPGGGHASSSGTSMAAPHVAGVVALCLGQGGAAGPCAAMTPAQIIQRVRSDALARLAYTESLGASYGFTGDVSSPVTTDVGTQLYGPLATVPGIDITPPDVAGVSPRRDSTGVSTATAVSVTFSEAMDRPATQAGFRLLHGTTSVAGTAWWSGSTLWFRPASPLAESADYWIEVDASARDVAGNLSGLPWRSRFRTWTTRRAHPQQTAIQKGSPVNDSTLALAKIDRSYHQVASTRKRIKRTRWTATASGVPRTPQQLVITTRSRATRRSTQTLSVYRWTTRSWVALDTRRVGRTDVTLTKVPPGVASDYVHPTSLHVRVQLRATRTKRAFRSDTDYIEVKTVS